MKTFLFIILATTFSTALYARHGKGGVLTYQYLGAGTAANTSKYRFTAIHYIDCDQSQTVESSVYIGVFDAASNALMQTITIPKTSQSTIRKTSFGCISPAPEVCYIVATYVAEVELPNNTAGYVISEQECCRISGIVNLQNSSSYGSTNTNTIPGIINSTSYRNNSSPVFGQKDTAVICHDAYFVLDFGATDADGDSLSYAFCAAKAGASSQNRQPNPPTSPPYADLLYQSGFSGGQPLGSGVTINAKTGVISGTAPGITGAYIISVCVSEYRNGVLLSVTKKEVQVEVADCNLSSALLEASYINCNDYTFTFQNLIGSSAITNYSWDFGVANSTTDISTDVAPTFTYPDTGHYVLKLKLSTTAGCEDSTTADVYVYPGFNAGFTVNGSCYLNPFLFTDTTKAAYGSVNNWAWSFGDGATAAVQNPTHNYSTTGTYTATLIVSSTKGCVDTVSKAIVVNDKPLLSLPFRDTLICSIDSLMLQANGNGVFAWSPQTSMINAGTATPTVFPKDTTTYYVTLNENGCIAQDSVKVNVLDFITVSLPEGLTICQTDSVQLQPESQALQYSWSPATALSNAFIKNPMAAPLSNITYSVTANLGKCQDRDSVHIKVVPYPVVSAGADTVICYSTTAQLHGAITGSSFTWTPSGSLQNAGTLSPTARPTQTTAYVLAAYDTLGCPKPGYDTVVVTVVPRINAFAGNDTLVIVGQPLQLSASGGMAYQWSPALGLSDADIANPVAILSSAVESVTYTVRVYSAEGCYADDNIKVLVFKTGPDIFMPTAFTPNGDGRNDVIKPILVGMRSLENFAVYNRWGQLVFRTSEAGRGWDGRINGALQPTGVFVYIASGTTYLQTKVVKKGTITLIR